MSASIFNASRPSKTRRIWIPFTSWATDGSTLVLACNLTYIGPLAHTLSKHRSRPQASMSGYARWWQNFIPEGYGLYQQWRNGKNFGSI